jgi:tRNA uridine 5-carboxymethylaminomethyl modification enzyme
MENKLRETEKMVAFIINTSVTFTEANIILSQKGSSLMTQGDKAYKVFSRPEVELEDIITLKDVKDYIKENQPDEEVLTQVAIDVKYSGYIDKERNNANKPCDKCNALYVSK